MVYRQDKLTFILTPEKVIIKTNQQTFFLNPVAHYFNRRLRLIRTMVELGEIRNLNELSSWCSNGNIAWVDTKQQYEVND